MVSNSNYDDDTVSGSVTSLEELQELKDISTFLCVETPPTIDLGDKPPPIAAELRTVGKGVNAPGTRVTKKNFEASITKHREIIDTANTRIESLKELAAGEHKSRIVIYDEAKSNCKKLEAYARKVLKTAGKFGEDNKRVLERNRVMDEQMNKLKDSNKRFADNLKDVKKDNQELKKEKKALLDNIAALNKAATDTQKTIDRHEKTIGTFERQLLKTGGGGRKEEGFEDEVARARAKNQAKLEASMQQKYMDLEFKEIENKVKADAKSNRVFGSYAGGGIGMMGMMGGGMMGAVQNSWNNRMDMVRSYYYIFLLFMYSLPFQLL
jgi:hypothetical protein